MIGNHLLLVHEKAGVVEFVVRAESANEAVDKEIVMAVQDRYDRMYDPEDDAVVLPAGTEPNHPVVQKVDEAMNIEVEQALRDVQE